MLVPSLAAALALILPPNAPQTASPAADRITYGQLVKCAATFRAAAALAEVDGQTGLVEPALLAAAAHAHLAYLYGGPLGVADDDTDAAVQAELDDQITTYGRLLGGPSDRLARQAMETDQQICQAVSTRVLRETERVSGTS